jgi:hypothetical protein
MLEILAEGQAVNISKDYHEQLFVNDEQAY